MPSKKFALVGFSALLLCGCTALKEIGKTIDDSREKADAAMAQQNSVRKSGAVVRMSGAKLAGDEILIKNSSQLPPIFNKPFYYLSAHQPLPAILGEINRRTGVPSEIQADVQCNTPTTAVGVAAQTANNGIPNFNGDTKSPIAVDWNGDLKGLLDYLANASHTFWKYEDGRIFFFKTETRSFHVFLPAGKRQVRSAIALSGTGTSSSSGTGGGSSGGNSGSAVSGTVDVTSTMEVDAYDAIVKSVQNIVSSVEGGSNATTTGTAAGSNGTSGGSSSTIQTRSVIANPSLGIVTVTSTPAVLDRVASYIRSVNERFAQNVMIGVKVFSLSVNNSIDLGASLAVAYGGVGRKYGVSLGQPSAGTMPILGSDGTRGAINSLILDSVGGGKWSGSRLLLEALETIGDVQFVTSGQVIAANGQPSPLQIATNKGYVSSSTFTPGTLTTPAVKTTQVSTLTTGFTANFLPLVLGDNRIMLQYQLNLSQLLSLVKFPENAASDADQVQLPEVASQSLQQQAFVRDGQSIVLFGFEQTRATADRELGLLRFNKTGGSKRDMMVIVLEVYSGK